MCSLYAGFSSDQGNEQELIARARDDGECKGSSAFHQHISSALLCGLALERELLQCDQSFVRSFSFSSEFPSELSAAILIKSPVC